MLIAALASRWVLFAVLGSAAVTKLGNTNTLRNSISRYRLVPAPMLSPLARLLPGVEVLLAFSLAAGILVAPAAIAAACLFLIFGLAIAINLFRGERFDCGCGSGPAEISWGHVGRNAVLAGLAVIAAVEPAVLALGGSRVNDAPATSDLVAVVLCAVLVCMATRLIRPVRDTVAVAYGSRERVARAAARPTTEES